MKRMMLTLALASALMAWPRQGVVCVTEASHGEVTMTESDGRQVKAHCVSDCEAAPPKGDINAVSTTWVDLGRPSRQLGVLVVERARPGFRITQTEKAIRLRALHEGPGAFVIPNPWDAGFARILAGLGFPALATSSGASALERSRLPSPATSAPRP